MQTGKRTILTVDDDADKSELLSLILKDAGYHVISASDAGAALEIAQRDIPSLIISDVSMPAMDGIEFCRLARADEKLRRVPIMLVTAVRKDTESLARGLEAGADDYLEAPFDPGRLVAKVARLIERKRTDEPLAILASIVENSEKRSSVNGLMARSRVGISGPNGFTATRLQKSWGRPFILR